MAGSMVVMLFSLMITLCYIIVIETGGETGGEVIVIHKNVQSICLES